MTHSYRNLRAWQAADELAVAIFVLAGQHWTPPNACVWDQLRRASLSVALNLAEGYAQGPGARCRLHFRIAYGSAIETAALLDFLTRVGIDTTHLTAGADATKAMVYRLWQRSRSN